MRRWICLSLSTALAILVLCCKGRPERVVIGAALSIASQPAAELAVKEIHEGGGIDGVPLELIGGDWEKSRYDAEDTLRWAQHFLKTPNLLAVIGHEDSTASMSSAPLYNDAGVPQILTISTHPAITGIGEWTFRICVSDSVQARVMADYAIHDWGKKNISVFYANDDYGRGLAELFQSRVRELGGKIVSSVFHRNTIEDDDEEVIRSAITRSAHTAELFVLFQRLGAARWTIETIRDAGLDVDILGSDNLTQPHFLESAPELLEGVRSVAFFFPDRSDARAARFVEDFRDLTGRDANYAHAFAYDAVYLIRDAVLHGGFRREGVKSYLDGLVRDETLIKGVSGAYRIGPDRDARRDIHIVESHQGRYRLLKTLPPAS